MTLSQQVLADRTRPRVIEDLVQVVQQEVASKSGMSGAAVRTGYAAASKVVPDLTERALTKLFPDFARALDPFWSTYVASEAADFGRHLATHGEEVSTALLAVTDAKVHEDGRPPIKRVYRALRGKAEGHVRGALPRLGAALEKHAVPSA